MSPNVDERKNGRDQPATDTAAPGNDTPPKPPSGTEGTSQTPSETKTARQLLPSVTLPKGGGAIRAIDEKFAVNSSNGTGRFAIPLPLTPGRFAPSLTLEYDSGAGNGPFGFGWNLSLAAITRKTDKGLPLYCDGAESDVYVLAGAEDLVPVLDAKGARVQLPARTVHKTVYHISLYRPRIEGLFSRIERWVAADTGIIHWRTITRENVTALYGYDAGSRIADPSDATKIFSWRISRTWDDKGNLAVYTYVAEDGAGINAAAAHEVNRTSAARAAQSYIRTIEYGNIEPWFPDWSATGSDPALPADWAFSVVFDYGDHTSSPPSLAPNSPWALRPDPFSSYRSCFEIRTYRRVQRVLFFNNFPKENVGANALVRSLNLLYSDQQAPADPHNPIYTMLVSAALQGYGDGPAGAVSRALPAVEFTYSTPVLQSAIATLDPQSLGNLPEGIDGSRFQWVDLDGEGLSGILSDTGSSWLYKRNLSANNLVSQPDGSVTVLPRFGDLETVAVTPADTQIAAPKRLLALAGDGRLDVATLSGLNPGFFKRAEDEQFEPFRPFLSLPAIDWESPDTKLIDLTGDGLTDALVTEEGVFTFYTGLGEAGFDAPQIVRPPWDEERGPAVVFSDGTETIFVADMSGDGLNDIVRVRNGEACYWPNIGCGRFGAKITMDSAPRFDGEDRFDPKRLRLADIDGCGSADLLYIADDGVHAWFNQSGNGWSARNDIAVFPTADQMSSVNVFDLLGTGTACLVWSSPLPSQSSAPMRYVDLMGGQKPHLLVRVVNNLGAETRVTYAPSTRFYVADEQAGTPWVTRLPFPVQVVERIEFIDWIGRNRLVTRYAYHHGYYDGFEREFRGFGRVDKWDTEEFRADVNFDEGEFVNWSTQSWSPPMLTKSWFHTGAFREAASVTEQYLHEYWIEPALRDPGRAADAAAMRPPDTVIPPGLNPYEVQEAYRSLKGRPLRIETYAQDGSPAAENPYTVTEQNFSVTCLQPIGINLHGVFFVSPREALSFHYERATGDPRVTHDFTLETDPYGNVTRSVSVGYSRRSGNQPPEPALPAAVQTALAYDQTRLHIAATEHQYTNAVDDSSKWPDSYRTPLPAATNVAEITGRAPSVKGNGVTNLFSFTELDGDGSGNGIWQNAWSGAHDIPYEVIPSSDVDGSGSPAASLTRRFIAQNRTLYRSDDLSALLPPGKLQPLALAGESYTAALTPGLLSAIFGALVPTATLTEGGYVQLPNESGWWARTGRIYYSLNAGDAPPAELAAARAAFFLPRRAVDPFGAVTAVTYDAYALLPVTVTDPVGNFTAVTNDYRVMHPATITDPNGNRSSVAFDVLGYVTATAVMGKSTETFGDALNGFTTDLDEATIAAQVTDPLASPVTLLGNATTRVIYDANAYQRTSGSLQPSPPAVYTLSRETHVSDLAAAGAGATTRYQYAFTYGDGFGREIQRKILAAPGPLTPGDAQASPRWLASGWTIFNNKGKPVRKYEPFFTATNAFEFAVQSGVSTVLLYDSAERIVATLHPDNTWEKAVFDAWLQQIWDPNDTVAIADPRTDNDVGGFFQVALDNEAFTSWYDLRIGGAFGASPTSQAAQKDAAQKAAAHAGTFTVHHFDALGRTCLAVSDNGGGNRYAARTANDTEGKPLAVFDPLGRRVEEYCYRLESSGGPSYIAGTDMAGGALFHNSSDGGARRAFNNVAGKPIRAWDARAHAFRLVYDAAQRQTHRYVSTSGAAEILIDLSIYGEGQPAANLCGRLFRHYDMAGYAENKQFDYKGNLLSSVRQLGITYQTVIDWTPLAEMTAAVQLDATATTAGLVPSGDGGRDRFVASTAYDALNRPIQTVSPYSATMKPDVLRHGYDEGTQLLTVDVWLQQTSAPTTLLDPSTADRHAITSVTYNARGQRLSVAYGNGTSSAYAYDLQTFRLTNLTTTRPNTIPVNAQSVQDLAYFYDPVGNITKIRDDADTQNVVYFNNQRVEPSNDYTYDPLYRLIAAVGREHLGQTGGAPQVARQVTNDDSSRTRLPQPGDGAAMGVYTETYTYDAVGNILGVSHQVGSGAWKRTYAYDEASQIVGSETCNRLTATSLPGDPAAGPFTATYAHDVHGNMTRMPHLPSLTWDEDDHLRSTTRQIVTAGTAVTTYYAYDSGGKRVRKVTNGQANVGQMAVRTAERIYFGRVDVYREFAADGATITLQRETLHVDGGALVVARVETRTFGTDDGPTQLVRYQLANHLSSAVLELGDESEVISYEEYFPFGSTSYQAVANAVDVPKRYRYTDKERDDENDLYYHGARYYAPWLGRWTARDPAGLQDGLNVFHYVSNNPIQLLDRTGKNGTVPQIVMNRREGIAAAQDLAKRFLQKTGFAVEEVTTIAGKGGSRHDILLKTRSIESKLIDLKKYMKGENLDYDKIKKLTLKYFGQVAKHERALESKGFLNVAMTEKTGVARKMEETLVFTVKNAEGKAEEFRELVRALSANTKGPLVGVIDAAKSSKTATAVAATVESAKTVELAKAAALVSEATKTEKVLAATAKIAKAAAPFAKALKPLAKVAKVAGPVAGALGIATSAYDLATAKTQEQKVDAGIGLAGNALMASENPVLMAGGAGVLTGQYLEHKLNVSEYSSGHGMAAKEYLEKHGVSSDTALVAGAVVTVASTPVALAEGAYHKVASWF